MKKRTDRLNSLLREVLSKVIHRDVKNPNIKGVITVTGVDITKDLREAKVYISIMANTEQERQTSLKAIQSASGFIGSTASKEIVIRYFPSLKFILDDSAQNQLKMEQLIQKIHQEKESRGSEKQ